MESPNLNLEKMLSFGEFCKYFGIKKSDNYTPIVDAYIQYQSDFVYGGYVKPESYFLKK